MKKLFLSRRGLGRVQLSPCACGVRVGHRDNLKRQQVQGKSSPLSLFKCLRDNAEALLLPSGTNWLLQAATFIECI